MGHPPPLWATKYCCLQTCFACETTVPEGKVLMQMWSASTVVMDSSYLPTQDSEPSTWFSFWSCRFHSVCLWIGIFLQTKHQGTFRSLVPLPERRCSWNVLFPRRLSLCSWHFDDKAFSPLLRKGINIRATVSPGHKNSSVHQVLDHCHWGNSAHTAHGTTQTALKTLIPSASPP